MRVRLGIFDHAGNIHHHHRLVADDPGIVTRRQQGHFARTELRLAAINFNSLRRFVSKTFQGDFTR